MPPWASAGLCVLASLAVVPWWLRAVCRECSLGTGRRSTALALAGLVGLSALLGWRFAGDPALVAWWWSGVCSAGLAVIDVGEHRLPRSWVSAMGIVVLLMFTVLTAVRGDPAALWRAVSAAALVWLVMRLVEAVCAGAMGGGDTRLQAVLALQLGWLGWHTVLTGLAAGMVLLGFSAGIQWLVGTRGWKARIPAGPSLLVGCWCALFVLAP